MLGASVVVMCPTMTRPAAAGIAQIHQHQVSQWCVLTTRGSHEAVLEGEGAGGGTRGDAQLGKDVLQMTGDGVLAEHQRC